MSKSWDRPWSTDEIVDISDSWSLAGDVALLHTIRAFADNIISRTSDIDTKLQSLSNTLDETSLRLDIAQNEFRGLRNTQFIESRVYEDDETLPVTDEKKPSEKTEDHVEEIRQAALKGLQVLEDYFEKVEVSVSDSEDEDMDLPNYVLRPRDLYIQRPLPYVIGTPEWHKSWHVGLEDSSSDSETDKVAESFSESDSEPEPIIQDRSQIKGTSDTSSELSFSQRTEKLNIPNSSDSDNSVPVQTPIPNFAEQLAAKLGSVIAEPEVNTRPIMKQSQKSHYGDIFFDEPPPLDEPKGLFSGGGGLFDDDECPSPKNTKSGGLFDEEDSDEDTFGKKVSPSRDLFPDEPSEVKRPVGGVSILGAGNLFDKKLLRRQPSSEEEEEEPQKVDLFEEDLFAEKNEATKKIDLFYNEEDDKKKVNLFDSPEEDKPKEEEKKVEEPKPKLSLFDDDDDLFSTTTKKSFTSGLFDDIHGEDLFAAESPKGPLFDDFLATDKNSINVDTTTHSLFDSPPPEPDDLFGPPNDETSDLFSSPIIDIGSSSTPNSRLFDPNPPPDDEWDTKSEVSENEFPPTLEEPPTKSTLFSDEPPPLEPMKPKPGKLKHTLKINVGALMPGYVPPKREDPIVASPTDVPDKVPVTTTFEGSDQVEVLPSVTKDRARVPLKRRPSTRQGRRAAIKNSSSDFKLQQEGHTADSVEEPVVTKEDEKSSGESLLVEQQPVLPSSSDGSLFGASKDKGLFESTPKPRGLFDSPEVSGDEDLFATPEVPQQDLFATLIKDQPKKVELPPEVPNDDDDLFAPAPQAVKTADLFAPLTTEQKEPEKTTPKEQNSKKESSLFDDDDDDDDDLFSPKKPMQVVKTKKSLFDDDDDDDIFKDFSAGAKKPESRVPTEKKVPKVSSVKKLENTKPDDDPLSALLK